MTLAVNTDVILWNFSEREFDKDRPKEKVESSAESDEDEGEET